MKPDSLTRLKEPHRIRRLIFAHTGDSHQAVFGCVSVECFGGVHTMKFVLLLHTMNSMHTFRTPSIPNPLNSAGSRSKSV